MSEKNLPFIHETKNTNRICVKFVRRYSREAHEKCAKMGVAPKLRGLDDIGAGWKMVIMDTRDGEYGPFNEDTHCLQAHIVRGGNAWPSFIKPT